MEQCQFGLATHLLHYHDSRSLVLEDQVGSRFWNHISMFILP
jgi:hypothetical protein